MSGMCISLGTDHLNISLFSKTDIRFGSHIKQRLDFFFQFPSILPNFFSSFRLFIFTMNKIWSQNKKEIAEVKCSFPNMNHTLYMLIHALQ